MCISDEWSEASPDPALPGRDPLHSGQEGQGGRGRGSDRRPGLQPEAAGHGAAAGQRGLIRAAEHTDRARPRLLRRAQRGAAQGQVLRLLEQAEGDSYQIKLYFHSLLYVSVMCVLDCLNSL